MNKSTLLSIIGGLGVVATTVLAVRATPKALRIIEEAKSEKGEDLTKIEIVRATTTTYLPALATGVATIACIFSANALNQKQQALMSSSYALLSKSFHEYRKQVDELYGEDADKTLLAKVAEEEYNSEPELCFSHCTDGSNPEEHLFFDLNRMRYFEAPMDEVINKTITEDGLECIIISTPF